MSRIGKLPVSIPEGVEINVSDDNTITVKGKLGELTQKVNPEIKIIIGDGIIKLERPNDQKKFKSLHGLYRSLIFNMVKGVTEGYKIVQEVVGVGYKAIAKEQILELSLGYSHSIFMKLPPEVKVVTLTERGKNPLITLTSHDKQLVGQVAAKIRSLRKPEPYKGKGIRYQGELIRKKAGKAVAQA